MSCLFAFFRGHAGSCDCWTESMLWRTARNCLDSRVFFRHGSLENRRARPRASPENRPFLACGSLQNRPIPSSDKAGRPPRQRESRVQDRPRLPRASIVAMPSPHSLLSQSAVRRNPERPARPDLSSHSGICQAPNIVARPAEQSAETADPRDRRAVSAETAQAFPDARRCPVSTCAAATHGIQGRNSACRLDNPWPPHSQILSIRKVERDSG